jgi:hypothetical protein
MSRIKITVKGQAGTGHHRVAEAILAMLDSKGANIRVDSLIPLRAGNVSAFNGMGLRVKLKVVHEPPIEPVAEPTAELDDEDLINCRISIEEVRHLKVRRGQKRTGYNVHQDKEGRFYYWSWGRQPAGALLDQIADKDPSHACGKFLAIYLPCDPKNWGDCIQPKRKDGQPIVGATV